MIRFRTFVSAGGATILLSYVELNAVTAIVPALVLGTFLGGAIGAACGVVPGALIATVVVPAYAAYELAE